MNTNPNTMTPIEKRATLALAGIMSLRMLGLFMILPIFVLFAHNYDGATPALIGLAIGIYGLTQALLQIPMGLLSDRWGRKPVITLGLLTFALGSVVAALSSSIFGVIIGRALQGAGAVAAAILALTADLTREQHRTKAMAILGMSIGMAFVSALVLGPVLSLWLGLAGIFWLIAVLAVLGIVILYLGIPTPAARFHRDTEPVLTQFAQVLQNPELLRFNAGIFILHSMLTSLFTIVPLSLQHHLAHHHHWWIYLPVMLLSILAMVPCIIVAEKYQRMKPIFVTAVAALLLAQLGFYWFHTTLLGSVVMLWLFFTAFNVLEASLPSLISKTAPADSKGTAMGVYASSQFFGAFLGGLGGGWLQQHYGVDTVFVFGMLMGSLWLLLAATMRAPRYLTSHLLNVGQLDPHQAKLLSYELLKIPGVAEAVVVVEDGIAYLKVDAKRLNFEHLNAFSVAAPETN